MKQDKIDPKFSQEWGSEARGQAWRDYDRHIEEPPPKHPKKEQKQSPKKRRS